MRLICLISLIQGIHFIHYRFIVKNCPENTNSRKNEIYYNF